MIASMNVSHFVKNLSRINDFTLTYLSVRVSLFLGHGVFQRHSLVRTTYTYMAAVWCCERVWARTDSPELQRLATLACLQWWTRDHVESWTPTDCASPSSTRVPVISVTHKSPTEKSWII